MRRAKLLGRLAAALSLTLAIAPPPALALPAAQDASGVTVLVGAGQDTSQLLNYFPANVRVHAGDTVTWKIFGDELHTVAFIGDGATFPPFPASAQAPGGLPGQVIPTFAVPIQGGAPTDVALNPLVGFPTRAPGAPVETYSGTGFAGSGILQKQSPPGAPPNTTFSLMFDSPGTYSYLCLIHTDRMFGTVQVVGADEDADTPDSANARAQAEIAAEMPLVAMARDESKDAKREPGPNNSTTWYVKAGASEVFSGDGRAQAFDFFPKNLTVKSGDSVVWGSTYFHTVSFSPTPQPPDLILLKPQPQGPPILQLNPLEVIPAKPAATYDPTKFYNSSDLGPFSQAGYSWSLAFDKPGTYEYWCLVHVDLGMKGTITVQAR